MTILLLAVETGIAAFVTGFVRDYVGDVLVVVLVYCLVRSFVSLRTGLLPLLVFVFAAAVELSQKLGLVTALGLENVPVARTVLGTTFDSSDIACYAVGCLMLLVVEIAVHVTRRSGGR
ncbi:MAG: DUF2809 domain-containing protein [Micrococcales bacterium]|nr:DUF2809 domain-containing protein [Micrococcales bacterium]